jgi:hypothetical protein
MRKRACQILEPRFSGYLPYRIGVGHPVHRIGVVKDLCHADIM